jgi:hypothetical protein
MGGTAATSPPPDPFFFGIPPTMWAAVWPATAGVLADMFFKLPLITKQHFHGCSVYPAKLVAKCSRDDVYNFSVTSMASMI